MNNEHSIKKFIELRVQGKTYDEIVKKLKISKPTLIKWGKLYKYEIYFAGQALTLKLAERVAKDNEQLIVIIAENLRRAHDAKDVPEEIRDRYVNKAFKKLGRIFKVDVSSIELTFFKGGDIKEVKINTR